MLSLIGGILILVGGVASIFLGAMFGAMTRLIETLRPEIAAKIIGQMRAVILLYAVVGAVTGVPVIIGAVIINRATPPSVRGGSILVMIASALSIILSGGGFLIGAILGLIGGILGLLWKPSPQSSNPST